MARTPSERWKKKIERLRNVCQDILAMSPKIRYVGAINKYGRTLTGILRPGVVPLLDYEHAKNEFFLVANLINMRNMSVKSLGRLDHITLQYDKVYIVLFTQGDHLYYVSVGATVRNISGLIRKIRDAVRLE